MWQPETGYRPPRAIARVERIPIALTDTGTPSAARRLGVLGSGLVDRYVTPRGPCSLHRGAAPRPAPRTLRRTPRVRCRRPKSQPPPPQIVDQRRQPAMHRHAKQPRPRHAQLRDEPIERVQLRRREAHLHHLGNRFPMRVDNRTARHRYSPGTDDRQDHQRWATRHDAQPPADAGERGRRRRPHAEASVTSRAHAGRSHAPRRQPNRRARERRPGRAARPAPA